MYTLFKIDIQPIKVQTSLQDVNIVIVHFRVKDYIFALQQHSGGCSRLWHECCNTHCRQNIQCKVNETFQPILFFNDTKDNIDLDVKCML